MDAASTPDDHHHRDVRGGAARAAVFGMSDGLVSNVSLILGVAGATTTPGVVRLAGLAGLVAGACSMAAGEYVSMRAQSELLERELDIERREIDRRPDKERRELAALYRSRGIDASIADDLAHQLMRDPQLALETHAREELGIDPSKLGSPVAAAASSFASFGIGAVLPLLPWFATDGGVAVVASVVIGSLAALLLGASLAAFTGRPKIVSALRQWGFAAVAAAVTYGIGSVVGIGAVA